MNAKEYLKAKTKMCKKMKEICGKCPLLPKNKVGNCFALEQSDPESAVDIVKEWMKNSYTNNEEKFAEIFGITMADVFEKTTDDFMDWALEEYHSPKENTEKYYWKIIGNGRYAQCSNCGMFFQDVYDFDNYDNYCRHCGAKMEGIK